MRFAETPRDDLDPAWTRYRLARARFVPAVTRLIMPPPAGTAKNWAAYRARFVEPRRIRAGVRSARTAGRWLSLAEERNSRRAGGHRGRHRRRRDHLRPAMGAYRVLDALATLVLRFPHRPRDRTPFFRGELQKPSCATASRESRPCWTAAGQLCRRDGHAAVHALQPAALRHRLRRRWPTSTCSATRPM